MNSKLDKLDKLDQLDKLDKLKTRNPKLLHQPPTTDHQPPLFLKDDRMAQEFRRREKILR